MFNKTKDKDKEKVKGTRKAAGLAAKEEARENRIKELEKELELTRGSADKLDGEEDSGEEDVEESDKELPKMPTPEATQSAQATQPKPLSQQEILTVAEDYLNRANELIKYARGIR